MKIILNIWVLLVIVLHGAYPHAEKHDSTQVKVKSKATTELPSFITIFIETNSVCNHLENFAVKNIFYTFVTSCYGFSNFIEITHVTFQGSHVSPLESHDCKQRDRAPPTT